MKELNNIKFSIKQIEKLENGGKYYVEIKVPMSIGFIERMKCIVENDEARHAFQLHHVENKDNFVYFHGDFTLDNDDDYFYYFSFEANHTFIYYKKKNKDNINTVSRNEMWKLPGKAKFPEWAKGKVMYHIFVDRFNREKNSVKQEMPNRHLYPSFDSPLKAGPDENGVWNNDFYGGDLRGIIEKLDYIESLGVEILYLSPVVRSQSNHRYDAGDYMEIDPYCGNDDDLRELCDKAHEKGMYVILDAVFNHTGNDSKYFNEFGNYDSVGAYQSKDSPYYDFYCKHAANGKTYFDHWWGMPNLPVCDGKNPKWQNFIFGEGGVIDKWFELGIDGLRLDVADELSDYFIEGIKKAVTRNKPDGFIIGEVWESPLEKEFLHHRNYYTSGRGLDSVMNYRLCDSLIRYFKYGDCNTLWWTVLDILMHYPPEKIKTLMNFTSTHDISRALNLFSSYDFSGDWVWDLGNWEDELKKLDFCKNYRLSPEDKKRGIAIYKAYLFALNFFPGILSIFYGDEVGVEGMGNLYNRQPFPWNNIDQEILNYFRRIGLIRKNDPFLKNASTYLHEVNPEYFMYERYKDDDEMSYLVVVNRTPNDINLKVPEKYLNSEILYRLNDKDSNIIKPYGGLVLKKIKK